MSEAKLRIRTHMLNHLISQYMNHLEVHEQGRIEDLVRLQAAVVTGAFTRVETPGSSASYSPLVHHSSGRC